MHSKRSTPPKFYLSSFNCPHCGALAHQDWHKTWLYPIEAHELYESQHLLMSLRSSSLSYMPPSFYNERTPDEKSEKFENLRSATNLFTSCCFSCKRIALWSMGTLLWPNSELPEEANPDMPDDTKVIYDEARNVAKSSPRAAAALLRLCVEKLMSDFNGKNLNEKISDFSKKTNNEKIQKALDVVRVAGNNAIHAGMIDSNDNNETCNTLFSIVNIITSETITKEKMITQMYENLPDETIIAISKRDGK